MQFAPGHAEADNPILNAFFIGGNVHSVNARAAVVTLIDHSAPGMLTASVNNVGFIGIVGVSDGGGGPAFSASAAVVLVANYDSSAAITNVSFVGCKFTANGVGENASTCQVVGSGYRVTGIASGGISGVNFTDVTFTGSQPVPVVYLDGYSSNTVTPNIVSTSNINFVNCAFIQLAVSPVPPPVPLVVAPVQVNSCVGYSFKNCTMTAYGTSATPCNAMVLGVTAGSANELASYGIIDGCSFFTGSSSLAGQSAPVLVQNGDMNAIQGWCKFFVGTLPSIPSGGVVGSTTSGVQIASGATNTFVDCVDFRGLNTATPISNNGTATRLGLNIISPAVPTGGLTLSKTNATLGSGTYTWTANATVLELTSTSPVSSLVTIVLPTSPNDGDVRVVVAPFTTYSMVNFSPAVRGFNNPGTISLMAPVTLIWGATGHWFVG